MKVIVAGCGRVGAYLAGRLSMEGHTVSVIDKDAAAFERLGKSFTGTTVKGMVFDGASIKKAGIEEADAFVSVTSGDNSNAVSALIAREVFKVPVVVARIYEPRRAEIYRRIGIQTVSSVTWASNEILMLMMHENLTREMTFGDGEVQMVRIDTSPRLVGRTVADLTVPGEVRVIAVIRGGKSFIPTQATILEQQDIIEVAVLTSAISRLSKMMAP